LKERIKIEIRNLRVLKKGIVITGIRDKNKQKALKKLLRKKLNCNVICHKKRDEIIVQGKNQVFKVKKLVAEFLSIPEESMDISVSYNVNFLRGRK
jgi:thiamine monophosphate synthase